MYYVNRHMIDLGLQGAGASVHMFWTLKMVGSGKDLAVRCPGCGMHAQAICAGVCTFFRSFAMAPEALGSQTGLIISERGCLT